MKFPRILVKAPNWIGDAVLATPFLTHVRTHWPEGHLTVLTRSRTRPVIERVPGVHEILDEPAGAPFRLSQLLRGEDYDVAFSLSSTLTVPVAFALAGIPLRVGFSGGGRDLFLTHPVPVLPRSVHQVEHYLALGAAVGMFRPEEPRLAWRVLPEDEAEAERFVRRLGKGGGNLVGFASGASYGPSKRWFVYRWAQLGDRLALERGARIVLVGGQEEGEIATQIARLMARPPLNATGMLSLGGTAALLKRCRAFVSNDSGLMHVGAAAGVPTVGLFGSSNPHWTRPYGREHKALWGHVPCSPCYRRTCLPGRNYACQDSLSVDRVLDALR